MTTYSKLVFSGATNGRGILVNATATPGDTIHTAHATSLDEIWIWAQNNDTVDRVLAIEFGGTTSPDDLIQADIPTLGSPVLLVPGFILTNSLVVKAFAETADKISVFGYVNRIT